MHHATISVYDHLDAGQAAEVETLLSSAAAAAGHEVLAEQKRLDVVRDRTLADHQAGTQTDHQAGTRPQAHASGARLLARGQDSRLAGYGHLGPTNAGWGIGIVVSPDEHAGSTAGDLLGAALDEAARRGGGRIDYWALHATDDDDRLASAHGLRRGRELLELRIPLPVPAVGGRTDREAVPLVTRPFAPGHDEAAWLAANNRAFSGHPEQGGWGLEELLGREQEAWFDPNGFLLHFDGTRLAGSCWTKIHRDTTPPLGEIYVISVDPDYSGRGLGRALTLAGLRWLADAGLRDGMLYVDADNTVAVALYRSIGFVDHHVDRAYTADIPPGIARR